VTLRTYADRKVPTVRYRYWWARARRAELVYDSTWRIS